MNLQEQISRIQEMMGVIKEELHNTSSADIKTIQSELINMLGNSNTDNGDRVKFVNRVFGSDSSFDIIFDNLDQEILDKINEFMDEKGWFPANIGFSGMKGRIYSQNFKDYLGDDDVQITYEAHSPDEIKITQTKAYHVTPDIFFNKINQEGLIPKSESKLSNHPDRVYLYRNQDKHKDIVWTLWNSLSKERQEQIKNYYVLEIDLTQIPNYNFFKDPQAMADYGAIYTDKPIPKSAIRVIDKIDTKGIETVDKDEMSKEEEKIASNELKQKEKERIDREKEQEKSDSEYAEYSKKVNDLPDNLKNIDIDDLLSLEEQIKKVIKKVINESDPKVGTGKKPKGSNRRLYTDENPSDTVSVKFKTKQDIVDTLNKESFKSKSHARQSQIINLIHQRLRVALERAKDPEVKKRLRTAFEYIESKKEASKRKTQEMKEEELTERCWKGYTQKGMKTMFGKRYPNCVKKKNKSLKEYWTPKEEDYSNIESAINKIIPKSFSWFKEIEIDNISYSEFSNTLTIYGELKVDEEWGAKQWREYYEYKPFPSNSGWEEEDPVRLGDIIGEGELDDLNDELELIVSSVGGYSIIDTMRLGQLKLYFV